MPVPFSNNPDDVRAFLQELEDRLAVVENPQQPVPLYACATVDRPAAADFRNCVYRDSTLNILAVSDGSNWIRQDTGASF